MVARMRSHTPEPKRAEPEEVLLVTLSSADGAVLGQATALDQADAMRCAIRVVSRRPFLCAGDTLRVTGPPSGEVHAPRETD